MGKDEKKMTAYIDLEAAVSAVKGVIGDLDHECKSMMDFYCALRKIPAADVAPVVHAKPVLIFDDPFTGRRFTTCSNCNEKIGQRYRYCKHCGAKMTGGDDSEPFYRK